MSLPNTLADIRLKVRRVTGRVSPTQISDQDIDKYINTFYVYDMPEHLKLESLRYNYQFQAQANIPAYDLPTGTYLTAMPPVFIAGYQSYMTQSRDNFFRINPELNFLQQQVYTTSGAIGTVYTGQFLSSTPIVPGFQTNPFGAYAFTSGIGGTRNAQIQAQFINWNVLVSVAGNPDPISGIPSTLTLIDDGLGNLIAPNDPAQPKANPPTYATIRGSINYITGAISINANGFLNINGAAETPPAGNAINVQYIPYVASRPQSAMFFQDQILLYPIPDQAYTVSFEAYRYPTAFLSSNPAATPQLTEWWQLLAYGAADKIFADNGDFENLQKFRPLLKEQMDLVLRRTIVQQTSERTSTIYTENQGPFQQFPFGNVFTGF